MVASHLCLRTACCSSLRYRCEITSRTVIRHSHLAAQRISSQFLLARQPLGPRSTPRGVHSLQIACAATRRNVAHVKAHSDLGYRQNVGVCLINREGLVFAARRIDDHSQTWQMPQGGIDEGEEPRAAAIRELKEETGISSARILAEHPAWLQYDFPPEVVDIWRQQGRKDHRGQRQKWFLMLFEGEDSEIDLDQQEPEFSEHKWVDVQEMPLHVVPFKRDVYQAVVEEFALFIPGRHSNGNGA